MSTGATCYRCYEPGRFRLSWLAYQNTYDYACLPHATIASEWAVITPSSKAPKWS